MGITFKPGQADYYNKVIRVYNRRVKCIVGIKPPRKARKYGKCARANSVLKVTAAMWRTFSSAQKLAWKVAAVPEGKTGYNLYTRDQCYRNKNSIAGSATPSAFHQYFIGKVYNPDAPAPVTFKIGWTFRPTPTLTMSINAKGELVAGGGGGSAKLVCRVKRFFIGQTFYDDFTIDLDLDSVWKAYTLPITNGPGALATCDFYLIMDNVNGTLYFDDVELVSLGVVLNDDPWCNNVQGSFVPVGSVGPWLFSSIYPPDDI